MPLLVAIAFDDRDGDLDASRRQELLDRDPIEGNEAPKPDTFPSSRQSTELHSSKAPALSLIFLTLSQGRS
jgi:hypothetical protein